MKHKGLFISICMAVALSLTGCGLWQSNQAGTRSLPEPPKPVISWNGKTAVTIPTSSCWSYENQGVCIDMAAPPEVVGEKKPNPLSVNPGAILTVTYELAPKDESLRITQWLGTQQIEQPIENGNQWKAPDSPGWYLFDIRGEWAQGDAGHAFVIEVRDQRL